ncbi:hypothetical protein MJO29_003748, partial [Puccinia striiformis f. sp. tritici]
RNETMTLYNEKGNRNKNRTKKVRNERASERSTRWYPRHRDVQQKKGADIILIWGGALRIHRVHPSLTMLASALSLFMSVKSSSLLAYSKVNPLISSQFEFDETKNLNEKYNQKKD